MVLGINEICHFLRMNNIWGARQPGGECVKRVNIGARQGCQRARIQPARKPGAHISVLLSALFY